MYPVRLVQEGIRFPGSKFCTHKATRMQCSRPLQTSYTMKNNTNQRAKHWIENQINGQDDEGQQLNYYLKKNHKSSGYLYNRPTIWIMDVPD